MRTTIQPLQSYALSRIAFAESDYFRSARNLAALYDLPTPDRHSAPYPLNVAQSFSHLTDQMKAQKPNLSLAILAGAGNRVSIATIKTLDIGEYAWYVPLAPVFRLLHCPEARSINPIIMEVIRFLYQLMGVPHYLEETSYLFHLHFYTNQWLDENDVDFESHDYCESCRAEIRRAQKEGMSLYYHMRKPFDIRRLEKTLGCLQPATECEELLETLGREFLSFAVQFGHRSLYETIPTGLLEPEYKDRVSKYHYLSFKYDDEGWLADEIENLIDGELDQYPVVDPPLAIQTFEKPQRTETHDLQFEETAFSLIDKLHHLLYHLSHEKYYQPVQ